MTASIAFSTSLLPLLFSFQREKFLLNLSSSDDTEKNKNKKESETQISSFLC